MERTIRVTGKGNMSVKPDTVRLIMTIEGIQLSPQRYKTQKALQKYHCGDIMITNGGLVNGKND